MAQGLLEYWKEFDHGTNGCKRGPDQCPMETGPDDYISLTDTAKIKDRDNPRYIIQSWMRNRNTIEYLGVWKTCITPI